VWRKWARMSRSAARLSEGKAQQPVRSAAPRPKAPRQLVKVELELRDGRYLLAYANAAANSADA
jgi:hypothetical protein